MKCEYCSKEATRYHGSHTENKNEHLCEEHYSHSHPEGAQWNYKGTCEICKDNFQHIIRHHISYLPCKTMLVCQGCHNKIHRGKGLEHLKPSHYDLEIFYAHKGCFPAREPLGSMKPLTNEEKKLRFLMKKDDLKDLKKEEKATVPWVKANVVDREVCDFFVSVLQAKRVVE